MSVHRHFLVRLPWRVLRDECIGTQVIYALYCPCGYIEKVIQ